MIFIFLLNISKYLFYINAIIEFDFIFTDKVIRILPAQLCCALFALCKKSEEQCNANQCIAAIMQIGNNNTAISFAANYSIYFLHFMHHIYFTNGAWKIFATMF